MYEKGNVYGKIVLKKLKLNKNNFKNYLVYAKTITLVSLQDEIDIKIKAISTDGYPMSLGELMNVYEDGELQIHPEFQRFFRWSIEQKSKLIESLFLGIPIPSIFVSRNDDGVWDVIDGSQRLSTIFQFVGILKDETGNILEPSVLTKTKYLPSLENKRWDDKDHPEKSLTSAQRIKIKRQKFDIKIVKESSDPDIKFELFQRINSLGTKLSDQELRNCVLIMENKSFYNWILGLSNYPSFQNCVCLSDKDLDEQYDLELVLRFFIFKNVNSPTLGEQKNISEFITEQAIQFIKESNFNREIEEKIFKQTFDLLNDTLGVTSFRRYNREKDRFEGKFLVTTFEAISIGVGSNIALWNTDMRSPDQKRETMISKARELWQNNDYLESIDRGVRFNTRARMIIPLGKQIFVP